MFVNSYLDENDLEIKDNIVDKRVMNRCLDAWMPLDLI